MAEPRGRAAVSDPREIQRGRSPQDAAGSPLPSSHASRPTLTARLASPVPSSHTGTPPTKQAPTPSQTATDKPDELPKFEAQSSLPGPGQSAIAAALAGARRENTTLSGTPPRRAASPAAASTAIEQRGIQSNYGSPDRRGGAGSPAPYEDPEIVRRHLVIREQGSRRFGQPLPEAHEAGHGMHDGEFSSLKLQGGDITRPIYRWTEEHEGGSGRQQKRSKSFHVARPEPDSEVLDISNIKVPGGFRRNFLRRAAESPEPSNRVANYNGPDGAHHAAGPARQARPPPQLLTSNFLEFLTIYGHFAGEELEEDDEVLEPDEYFSSDAWEGLGYDDEGSDREPGEGSALLPPWTPGGRRRKHKERRVSGTNTTLGATLLLLKSFVGTGVLFLPRAFLNGGMLFSALVLLGVALLSFHCFILLVNTRLKIEGSFGDIGGILYGKWMRTLILSSIVLSQIGFVSAYIVFTSENLQAFILAVSKCKTYINIKWMVLMQLIIFLPLSLIRDISKLGFTALIADVFIMLGLIYLYYYDIASIVDQRGVSDITTFNPATWTLFIGTAIFTFEGVGLIIPIQESMKNPKKFSGVLASVMIVITILFTSIGALSYAAYGSSTKTVVILNLPQDDKFVNAVQFLYSLAILLSTPLQLFPAIRIMENELFTRSGKYNRWIKWEKNVFRFVLVMLCAMVAWVGAGDLDKFVALVGSFACVPLVYVYPASSATLPCCSALLTLHRCSQFSTPRPSRAQPGRKQLIMCCSVLA
jgi:solute carrier family 36 (proton-coupled amino acid transporter)